MSNRAAVLYGVGDIRIEDRAEPSAGPGEVIVAIGAVGICGSDLHYVEHGRIGEFVVRAPMVLGHEAAGTIIAVGAGVAAERIGQVVALEPGIPDLTCRQCLAGRYNLCPQVRFFATPPVDGAIIERLAFPALFAHLAPAGIGVDRAAMAEPVSVGVWACRKAAVAPSDRVLVTGAGPVGLLAAQVARAFGAGRVTVSDINPARLQVATNLGLGTHRAGEPLPGEFEVLLECSGAGAAADAGMAALAPAGRVVLIGMGADQLPINVPLVQGRELTVTGVFRYANCYPTALELIGSGAIDVDPIITHHVDLAATAEAMTVARRDPAALKVIIHPTQEGSL